MAGGQQCVGSVALVSLQKKEAKNAPLTLTNAAYEHCYYLISGSWKQATVWVNKWMSVWR